MDTHFNLFQAYHGGNKNSPDGINRLEDNLTRAFLVALKYLPPQKVKEFLQNLGFKDVPKSLFFDLQNLSDKEVLGSIQKSKQKYVLLISRYKGEHFKLIIDPSEKIKKILNAASGEDDEDLEKMIKAIRNPKMEDVHFMGESLNSAEQKEVYALLHSARPDGWIYDHSNKSKFAVLVESKVGENEQSSQQIFRHITDKKYGLSMGYDDVPKYIENNVVSVSWEEVITKMPCNLSGITEEIINQFKEYVIMSGEVMDLIKLNRKYDHELAKSNLKILVDKLDGVILENKLDLERFGNLGDQWCAYGLLNKTDLKKPHFSVLLREEGVCCALTIPGSYISKILNNSDFISCIESTAKDSVNAKMHSLKLCNYRLVDKKPGQIKGEKYDTFTLSTTLSELNSSRLTCNDFSKLANNFTKITKQMDFIFKISWTDESKSGEFRKRNLELLRYPDRLIGEFVTFMGKFKQFLH